MVIRGHDTAHDLELSAPDRGGGDIWPSCRSRERIRDLVHLSTPTYRICSRTGTRYVPAFMLPRPQLGFPGRYSSRNDGGCNHEPLISMLLESGEGHSWIIHLQHLFRLLLLTFHTVPPFLYTNPCSSRISFTYIIFSCRSIQDATRAPRVDRGILLEYQHLDNTHIPQQHIQSWRTHHAVEELPLSNSSTTRVEMLAITKTDL